MPALSHVFYVEDFRVRGGVVMKPDNPPIGPQMGRAVVTMSFRGNPNPYRSDDEPVFALPAHLSLSPAGARELARRLAAMADRVEVDPLARTQDEPPRPLGPEWET